MVVVCLLVFPGPCFGQKTPPKKNPNKIKVLPDMTEVVIAEGSIIFNYVYAKRRRRLTLDVYRPENRDRLSPAIVMYFGGGWQNGRPGLFAPLAQALAQRGYVCVVPEYRLSGEAPFPAAVYDAKAAVRWTRKFSKRFKVDPHRIACLGGSAGGHLAGFVAATSSTGKFEGKGEHREVSSEVQAAVVMCGPMNLLDPNTVERIEKSDWIERKPHETDRRANRILLLPAGGEKLDELRIIAKNLQANLLGALPEAKREPFLEELAQVADACQQAAEAAARKNRD